MKWLELGDGWAVDPAKVLGFREDLAPFHEGGTQQIWGTTVLFVGGSSQWVQVGLRTMQVRYEMATREVAIP